MKKTKIVCTIGPATNTVDVMEKLALAGMNVARINFSHATIEEREQATSSVREVRKKTGINLGILWDTKGPEFRSGVLEGESIELVEGKTIKLVKADVKGNEERITVNHPDAIDSLEVGDTVLTTSGFYGVIIDISEEDVIVEFGNNKNCRIPMQKAAIAQLEKPGTSTEA